MRTEKVFFQTQFQAQRHRFHKIFESLLHVCSRLSEIKFLLIFRIFKFLLKIVGTKILQFKMIEDERYQRCKL